MAAADSAGSKSLFGDALLQYLEARVQLHGRRRPGLRGTVCVGVRRQGHMTWWIARCSETIATELAADLPADFDAGVAVDGRTALWILGGARDPGGFHLTTGDGQLLDAFVREFVQHTDVVAVRLRGRT